MHTENSTTTEKSTAKNYLEWAGIVTLVALAVGINGGANFYGGFILATEMGLPATAGYAVGAALAIVILFLLSAYLTGKRGLPVVYLHLFSGCLLMFDVVHFASISVNSVTAATGDIAQVEREIADIDFQIATAEKELDGMAATVTGNNVKSLTSQINALKNTTVSGGALWAVSAGCTTGSYRTKCGQIATLQGELEAEKAALSGVEVTKKRGEIAKLRGMRTEKKGMAKGMSQKSESAGFVAKMKPEGWSENGFLALLGLPFAVAFELFNVLAFGSLKNKLTPQNPPNREIRGTHQGRGFRAWIGSWDETLKNSVIQSASVYAEKKAIEEVTRNEELNTKIADVERKSIKLSGDVSAYIKILCPDEIGRIMDKNSVDSLAGQDKKARLKNSVHSAMMLFVENERLPQSGNNATWKLTNDAQKHFRLRTLPALIKIGMVSKDSSGAHWWVSASDAWKALGEPVLAANHSTAKAKDESDKNPIADSRPVRTRPKLRVV